MLLPVAELCSLFVAEWYSMFYFASLCGIWDLSSHTRDQTCALQWKHSLNLWTARKSLQTVSAHHTTVFTYSLVDGHKRCFQVGVMSNSTAMNICVSLVFYNSYFVSLCMHFLVGHFPRSRAAESSDTQGSMGRILTCT